MSARISIASVGALGIYFFVGAYFPRIMGRDAADLTWSIMTVGVAIMGLATASVLGFSNGGRSHRTGPE